ncbi:MAG: hypothetical protein K2X66_06445 [Cyanobacteria bacterium]|nr:hypothetical protein [Cyanobacteriota bacterium]
MSLNLSFPKIQTRFQGDAERQAYKAKFDTFSDETLAKLQQVQQAGTGPEHMALARQFAQEDPNVAYVNNEIRTLVQGREKATEPSVKEKFQETLNDFRFALVKALAKLKKN